MKVSEIIQETTSGGIAGVVMPMGQTLYRNPSIYDNPGQYETYKPKKKPKEKLND